jgi:hypothetical protein
VWTSFHARARGDVAGDVECLDENEESVEAHHMPPTTIEVDMKSAAITDVSGALLLGDLVTGLQRQGCNIRVINALPECRVLRSPLPRFLEENMLISPSHVHHHRSFCSRAMYLVR